MQKLAIEILYRAPVDGKPSVTLILPDNLSFLERQAIAEAILQPPVLTTKPDDAR
jgi:hypothetical protein